MLLNRKQISLYKEADQYTLGAVRIFIALIWLVKIASLDLVPVTFLELETFHHQGLMKLVPSSLIEAVHSEAGILVLKYSILYLLIHTIFGFGLNKIALATCLILTSFLIGYLKGFGGHVNHRELTLLYMSYLLVFFNCFSGFSLRKSPPDKESSYQATLVILCLVIVTQYLFVGIARLFVGTPEVFNPEVMEQWIAHRNFRDNPYGFTLGLKLLGEPVSRLIFFFALPFSTLVEILSPTTLFIGQKSRLVFVSLLASFHLGIFLLMNIAFFENIAVLLILSGFFAIFTKSK